MLHLRTLVLSFLLSCFTLSSAQVSLAWNQSQIPVSHASEKLRQTLAQLDIPLISLHTQKIMAIPDICVLSPDDIPSVLASYISPEDFDDIKAEGFRFKRMEPNHKLVILARDEVGAMYGVQELAEHIRIQGKYQLPENKTSNPTLEYRIIKFNLPWSSYRTSDAMDVHLMACRDLKFWERFLDMMAENRFNVLSLWNKHPFPYLIRAKNFPKATPFNHTEMADWQHFWKSLFRMARQRGIQTFIVNWNIVVSPAFAENYGAEEYNDLSEQVKRYTRESVTQLINEYEDLTGIGVTLADWMGTFDDKMTPQQREDWIEETFVAGMKAADRPIKFLHRSVLAGDPMAMRAVLDRADLKDPALVEIKFNWSHGHSTPTLAITHDYHSGKLDDRFWTPMPENYKIQWMIRNEDFFILRWGQPDFIREHIATNHKPYVNGYFIGSEGYIPAVDYSHKPSPYQTWQYGFEKQWLFYMLWGRLLYDPETPDEIFEAAFNIRYGNDVGKTMLLAYKQVSKIPLWLASFHRSTWDYTLYSEGFISAARSSPKATFDNSSPFISIDEFIDHETLDPKMISIKDYVRMKVNQEEIPKEMITPIDLTFEIEWACRQAGSLCEAMRIVSPRFSGAFTSELDDIATWVNLGYYFDGKLCAGVRLEEYRLTGDESKKESAIGYLEKCLEYWDKVIELTEDRYKAVPHVSTQHYGEEYQLFSWKLLRQQVVRDIEIAKGE